MEYSIFSKATSVETLSLLCGSGTETCIVNVVGIGINGTLELTSSLGTSNNGGRFLALQGMSRN